MEKNKVYPFEHPIPPDPLNEEKLNAILDPHANFKDLTEWKVVKSPLPENPDITRSELFREFKFENFDKVIAFINEIAIACEMFPHHPRWENVWVTLRVYLTTWDANHNISYKDIMLARYFDRTFKKYDSESLHSSTQKMNKDTKEFAEKIKLLVPEDTENAIEKLKEYFLLNPKQGGLNEIIVLSGRYKDWKRLINSGTEDDNSRSELTKIRTSLLYLIDQKVLGGL
jgi:pterin-4a-carbinolamine dehydratase